MDAKSKAELDSIIRELNSIITELEEISRGVRNDFKGIGNDKCANCINNKISDYRTAKNKLANIDTRTLHERFVQAMGGK